MSFKDNFYYNSNNKSGFKAKIGRMNFNDFKASIADNLPVDTYSKAKEMKFDMLPDFNTNNFDTKKGFLGFGKPKSDTTRVGSYNIEVLGANSEGCPVGKCDKITIAKKSVFLISTKKYSIFNPAVVDVMYRTCATYNNNCEYIINSCLGMIRDHEENFTGNIKECLSNPDTYGQTFIHDDQQTSHPMVAAILVVPNISGFNRIILGIDVDLNDGNVFWFINAVK